MEKQATDEANNELKDKYGADAQNFKADVSGVVRNRWCTDFLCLLVFLAYIGGMGFLAYKGRQDGNIQKLIAPMDGDKKFCGVDPGYEEYDNLFITSFESSSIFTIFESSICVKKCPALDEQTECKTTSHTAACPKSHYATFDAAIYCLPPSIEAMPPNMKDGYQKVMNNFKQSSAAAYIQDIWKAKKPLMYSFGVGVVYCFAYIYFMSIFAEQIAWTCIFLTQIALIAGTYYSFVIFKDYSEELVTARATYYEKKSTLSANEQKTQEEALENQQNIVNLILVGVVCAGLISLAFLCCVCCGFSSLKMAIDVIDASADFLRSTKRIIFVPMFYFVMTLMWFLTWSVAFAYVASNNVIQPGLLPQMKDIVWTEESQYYALYMVFGLLWVNAWIDYSCKLVTMISGATYYFNSNKDYEGGAEVCTGFYMTHFNHPGSIAFGSFIIAVVQIIRLTLLYIAKKAEKMNGDNAVVKSMIKCAQCFLACLEKVLDYINKQAFSYMAVAGTNFCSSAWNGFLLNIKFLLRFTFAYWIAIVFIFLGKVSIIAGNCATFFMIVKYVTPEVAASEGSQLAPLIVVGVVTYFTTTIFLGLFDTVVQSLLTSLGFDCDANGGKPKYGPPTFHEATKEISE